MIDLNLDQFYFEDSYIQESLASVGLESLTGGKNLRSHLLFLTSELFNVSKEDRLKLGRVVELVHNATLTHDDVIDNSHTRRGAPSTPSLIGNKKSVILGDYMLAKALHELSDFNNPELTKELTLTLKELVEGEWIQFENTNPYTISTELYETLAIKKTGSLFRWCFLAPLIASDPTSMDAPLFKEFGLKLGLIFQMTDDIIDFSKDSKKTYGLDFKNNNINFVLHFLGQSYPEHTNSFLSTPELDSLSEGELVFVQKSLSKAKKALQLHLIRCREILKILKEKPDSKDQTSLSEFSSILDLITDRVF